MPMPRRQSFDEVTQTLTSDEGLCRNDYALFHYFNPNGARADWVKACDELDEAVYAGRLKSGAIFAYGSLNDYHERQLLRQVKRKQALAWDTRYHVEGLRKAAAQARAKARGG